MTSFNAAFKRCLRDALAAAFWYKAELQGFLQDCLGPQVSSALGWQDRRTTKREALEVWLRGLFQAQPASTKALEALTRNVLSLTRYPSLEHLKDRKKRLDEARRSKTALREAYQAWRNPPPAEDPAPPESSPWDLLGLPPGTPWPDIQRRGRELLKLYHPDRFAALDQDFQTLAQTKTRRILQALEALKP